MFGIHLLRKVRVCWLAGLPGPTEFVSSEGRHLIVTILDWNCARDHLYTAETMILTPGSGATNLR